MRKLLLAFSLVAVVVVVVFPGVGTAGKPQVTKIDQTGQFDLCGVATTTHDVGVDVFSTSGNTFFDRYNVRTTFTAANGVVIDLHAAGTVTGTLDPVPNGDGTYTNTVTFKGLPEQFKLPNGDMLTRDAGIITFVDTLVPDGLGGFTLQSEQLIVRGPHPEADSGFNLECQILAPILAGA